MKTVCFFITLILSQFAYGTWLPFGPDSISANRVCFNIDNQNHWAVCHDGGIQVYDLVSQSWTNYPSEMPVFDACYLDGNSALVIMGDGTDSDGLYSFNPAVGTFEVIKYVETPHFIYWNWDNGQYFIGHHLGLLTSTDGWNWEDIEVFSNKNMVSMDTYQNHYAVSEMDNLYGVWYSDDSGSTWNYTSASPMISELSFDHDGILWGIFPDESWSSGLYCSDDFGETWNVKYWSVNMHCIEIDPMNNVAIGWGENESGLEEGFALFDQLDSTLNFINEGLSNLIINDIVMNPSMSAIALFCSTENGAYFSYDYFVRAKEFETDKNEILIYPNPADDILNITTNSLQGFNDTRVIIIENGGGQVFNSTNASSGKPIRIDCSSFPAGLYYVFIKDTEKQIVRKLVIQ